jgi:hypothetical protein
MLRGELHNRGSAGRCEVCGEIFPCPTGLVIYEAVKRELEHPTPPPAAAPPPPRLRTEQRPLYAPTWEEFPTARIAAQSACIGGRTTVWSPVARAV